MGALHDGHLALVRRAQTLADAVVCSIFVNPTQFNDPGDLEKYPRPIERDTALLTEVGCDILFHPGVDELYVPGEQWYFELGRLDQVLEGLHRPGHFQGVTQVVKKLFDAVQPDVACFGQKDFQQYKVVSYMVEQLGIPVGLELCPTVREADGLAMSSRNVRLSPEGRQRALTLYSALQILRRYQPGGDLAALQAAAVGLLEQTPGVQLEYLTVYDADAFVEVTEPRPAQRLIALVAAWVDGVRLIDNLFLN